MCKMFHIFTFVETVGYYVSSSQGNNDSQKDYKEQLIILNLTPKGVIKLEFKVL